MPEPVARNGRSRLSGLAPGWEHEVMASAVELIRVSNLSDVAEYAYAATVSREARLIFLAGACPLNEDGATAAIGDYAGQARVCVENLTRALAAAGASLRNVVNTRVLELEAAAAVVD